MRTEFHDTQAVASEAAGAASALKQGFRRVLDASGGGPSSGHTVTEYELRNGRLMRREYGMGMLSGDSGWVDVTAKARAAVEAGLPPGIHPGREAGLVLGNAIAETAGHRHRYLWHPDMYREASLALLA